MKDERTNPVNVLNAYRELTLNTQCIVTSLLQLYSALCMSITNIQDINTTQEEKENERN